MGREALCTARVGAETAEVTALLESTTVVLRGAIKRKWPIAALQNLRIEGEELRFEAGDEAVALVLGAAWAAPARRRRRTACQWMR